MPRDVTPLTNALAEATPGEATGVYSLLAAWNQSIEDFPDFPQHWEPETELDHRVEISDEVHERLLAVVGASIHPNRLRHFADSYRFDLERAADEYGQATDE